MTDFRTQAAAMLAAADDAVAPQARPRRVPAPCGSHAAAKAHYRRGEPLDPACREARRAYDRARAAGLPPAPARTLMPCGTEAAARRHRAAGEPVDWACQEAARAACRRRKAAARGQVPASGQSPPACGTTAGWAAHLRSGERPCPECMSSVRRDVPAAASKPRAA